MSQDVYWQVEGDGKDIVFLHGWGMNGAVWDKTITALKEHYRVHCVDLPGYGYSSDSPELSLEAIVARILPDAPKNAVWVGWSLGGLVASLVALRHPDYVSKLVTVASSPKFAASSPWRGIQPQVLSDFTTQLVDDFKLTIERFMALQAMGSPTARQDVKQLKKSVLSRPQPNPDALLAGLTMLKEIDLREDLTQLSQPMLRMYGRLDGLVPVKVAQELDKRLPNTESVIFSESSHAPFITETEAFVIRLQQFIESETR